MPYFTAACAYGSYVFLKAFQQRNVVFDHYRWIFPISILMGIFEVTMLASIYKIFQNGSLLLAGVSIGVGGAIGAILAMLAHKKVMK